MIVWLCIQVFTSVTINYSYSISNVFAKYGYGRNKGK